MENISLWLKKASLKLDEKLEDLKKLEAEKVDILKRYSKVDNKERKELELEIELSQQKFMALETEVKAIYEKIEKVKKQYI